MFLMLLMFAIFIKQKYLKTSHAEQLALSIPKGSMTTRNFKKLFIFSHSHQPAF
jgi:hypothetical protein